MSADIASRYIRKVDTKLQQIDETDTFSDSFMKAIKSGNNTLYQKHLSETRIFDGNWITIIEEYVSSIDMIVRDPKSFIKSNEDIVPIERAKKTTSESLRHLASHSQFVREVNETTGEVIPTKILTSFKEEDLAIYENRFVKTLIEKLAIFVERRYEVIAKLIGTDYLNKLQSKSSFKYEDIDVEYEINMSLKREIRDSILEKKNFDLLNRVEELRKNILTFRKSEFMKALANAKPVFAPIMKTNIIMKHPDYHKCYDLWLFLDSYDRLDYSIEMYDNEITFSDDYIDKLQRLVMLGFSTVVANDNSELGRIKSKSTLYKKQKKTRILDSLRRELENLSNTSVSIEDNSFNEFYLQESKKIYNQQVQKQVDEGEPFHVAVQEAYQDSFRISEAIFNQFLEMPEDIKNNPVASLRFRSRCLKVYEEIIGFKEKDLKKMKAEQAKLTKRIASEKKKIEAQLAKEREIEKLRNKGLTDDQIENRLLSPEERAKKREREKQALLVKKEKEAESKRLKLQKQKERAKEKERLLKLKLKEKEKLLKKKQQDKEKAKEKERLLKVKEKENIAKQKEAEKQKLKSEREKIKQAEIKKLEKKAALKKASKPKAVVKAKKDQIKRVDNINSNIIQESIDLSNDYKKSITSQHKALINKKKKGSLTEQEKLLLKQLDEALNKKISEAYVKRIESLKEKRRQNLGQNNFGDKGTIRLKFDEDEK